MDDQAQAVGPSVEDRIAAALGEEPEQVNLEPPPHEELPGQEAPQEPVAAEQPEQPETPEHLQEETPPAWDEVKEIKLKVPVKNGDEEKELDVTLDELRLGYMRQDDYQRKTQEISKVKSEAAQETHKAVQQTRQQFVQELTALDTFITQVAMPEFQNVDWNKLSQENPAQFVAMSHRANQLQQAKVAIKSKLQEVEQQRFMEKQQRLAQAIPQAEATLKSKIPNWSDELRQSLVKTAKDVYQRPDSELNEVGNFDPGYVEMLHDAHQWRQLKSQKSIVENKVREVPKVLKPGTKQVQDPNGKKLNELRARIKKSGGKDKAAIEERIKLSLR